MNPDSYRKGLGETLFRKTMKVYVKVPGTCGELVQGMIDHTHFLVTCPVDLYAHVSVSVDWDGPRIDCPQNKTKAHTAAQKTLRFLKKEAGLKISIASDIPIGKGMASSTADIAGVCLGIANALGQEISALEVSRIALSIEPTDGTAFPGISLFDHRHGTLLEALGAPPTIKILVVDLGGCVDTIEFNQQDFAPVYRSNETEILEALQMVKEGILSRDPHLIGMGATRSALCNQRILPKTELNNLIEIADEHGAYGVTVAHSGTVVGLLLDPHFADIQALKRCIQQHFSRGYQFYETNLIGGGGEVLESDPRREYQARC